MFDSERASLSMGIIFAGRHNDRRFVRVWHISRLMLERSDRLAPIVSGGQIVIAFVASVGCVVTSCRGRGLCHAKS
jgi:hypothetical protein